MGYGIDPMEFPPALPPKKKYKINTRDARTINNIFGNAFPASSGYIALHNASHRGYIQTTPN